LQSAVGDREQPHAIIGDSNNPQKHVWRARIVPLIPDGHGTSCMRRLRWDRSIYRGCWPKPA
jgi:hypothetical protein